MRGVCQQGRVLLQWVSVRRQARFVARERIRCMAAKKGNRIVIKLKSPESGHTYTTMKNRRNDPSRLELRKYDPVVRKHVKYRETK